MVKTKSYTFNGDVKRNLSDWLNWIDDAEKIYNLLKIRPTECSVLSKNGTKIKSVKSIRNKIINLYKKGDIVESMSFYNLKKEYESIIFDFTVSLTRNSCFNAYVTLILNYQYYDENIILNDERIISILRQNIIKPRGEVYEMDINECPEFYAGKANDKSHYKSLNIIKQI